MLQILDNVAPQPLPPAVQWWPYAQTKIVHLAPEIITAVSQV